MPVFCVACAMESSPENGPNPGDGVDVPTKVLPVQTVGLYRSSCPKGHPLVAIADFHQFQLLFESGVEAFAEIYLREAISSFAAALERYHEFAIRVLLMAQEVDTEAIDNMWKSVASQSERQIGMYIGLYTAIHQKMPNLLPQKMTALRNSVIHKGHFPTPQESFDFGNAVYALLSEGLNELNQRYPDALVGVRVARQSALYAQLRPGENPSIFYVGMTIDIDCAVERKPFEEVVKAAAARLYHQRCTAGPSMVET